MNRKRDFDPAVHRAFEAVKTAKTPLELRRAQAVLLTTDHGMKLIVAAGVLGVTPSTVSKYRSFFLTNGTTPPLRKKKGQGRRLLSEAEEKHLLDEVSADATARSVKVTKGLVQQHFSARLGRPVGRSTVEKMLSRNLLSTMFWNLYRPE